MKSFQLLRSALPAWSVLLGAGVVVACGGVANDSRGTPEPGGSGGAAGIGGSHTGGRAGGTGGLLFGTGGVASGGMGGCLAGVEVCNDFDDDCDGQIDEG